MDEATPTIRTFSKSVWLGLTCPQFYSILSKCLEPLAQLAEHLTFNQGVDGSNPSWLAKTMAPWRSGLTHQPFTLAFRGSNPLGVTICGAVV